ncbi:MAG: FIST N-terminal domain-containing protein [Ferruginibacter sp.]
MVRQQFFYWILIKNYFQIYFEEYPEKNYRQVTNTIARKSKEKFGAPAFFIAGSNMETDAEQLLFGFEDVAGKDVNVYGCMGGDDFTFSEQYAFTNGRESTRGLVCIALDEDKVMIKGVATCGWRAVGTVRTVTKSEGNHVYTVDDVPVLDISTKYGGLENVSPDNEGLLLEIAANFPCNCKEKRRPGNAAGLVIDWSDHSFYCSGTVPQGSKVRFSLPPDFDVFAKSN